MNSEHQSRRAGYVKFGITTLIYLLFLLWIRSLWGLVVVPFIFDLYVTHLVPWGWWKRLKSKSLRALLGWVDAIIFALVAVYLVNIYLFQNYQIPSSSLEKSLLVGDFLFVSKVSYGPRGPITPLSMPLTQHTLPVTGSKSYLDHPHWTYKRAPGLGAVKRNDIVVFNFPAGDTVALNHQMEDFYSLAYRIGQSRVGGSIDMSGMTRKEQRAVYDLIYHTGRTAIRSNPQAYGDVVVRPVDRRENYVKRCIGLPGDTLQIIDAQVYIDGQPIQNPKNMQLNYFVQTNGIRISDEMFRRLDISCDDRTLMNDFAGWEDEARSLGLTHRDATGQLSPTYHLPLTQEALTTLQQNTKLVAHIVQEPTSYSGDVYPLNLYTEWDRDNYGPIVIPSRGMTIELTEDNLPIYERCIEAYEGNTLQRRDDGLYINGEPATSYTFQMDYYWMMGDNRHNSLDSRYWGFVPEDHVVGKPIVVWLSLDKDREWLDGHIRWNRFFKWVDDIK